MREEVTRVPIHRECAKDKGAYTRRMPFVLVQNPQEMLMATSPKHYKYASYIEMMPFVHIQSLPQVVNGKSPKHHECLNDRELFIERMSFAHSQNLPNKNN